MEDSFGVMDRQRSAGGVSVGSRTREEQCSKQPDVIKPAYLYSWENTQPHVSSSLRQLLSEVARSKLVSNTITWKSGLERQNDSEGALVLPRLRLQTTGGSYTRRR